MSKRRIFATVPEPYTDVYSLYASVMALKELVEGLTGQRGGLEDQAVMRGDLPDRITVPKNGPWSPKLIPSTGAFAASDQTANWGYFSKIDKLVNVWFMATWTGLSIGSGSGMALLSGLPYLPSASASGTYWPGVNVSYAGGSTINPSGGLCARGDPNLYFYFPVSLNGSSNNWSVTHLAASGYLWGSGTYLTDS